jgi:hypothetical protein
LVIVAVWELVLPSCTLPKLTDVTARAPGVTPVPARGIENVGTELLLAMAKVALLLPAVEGANSTLNDILWPALSVIGKFRPLTLYAPPAVAWVRVMAAPLAFVSVSGRL